MVPMVFLFLGLFPQRIHFGKRHLGKRTSLFDRVFLKIVEPSDELLVGVLKGVVGVQVVEACGIDDAEKEIAQLACGFLSVFAVQLGLQFSQFFLDFCPYILPVFPVEADVSRLVLYSVCLDE